VTGALEQLRRDAFACHAAALAAVEPGALVAAGLADPDVRGALAASPDGVHLLATGKAAPAMARAAAATLGSSLRDALVVVPESCMPAPGIPGRLVVAGHPLPTEGSVRASDAALELAARTGPGTLLLVLLSGGTSPLLIAPVPPIGIADLRTATRLLLDAGADITALNTVRKHCSRLLGGGLLRAAGRAGAVWTLVLSDVLGDDLATIGSGLTVADPSTFADALAVLDRAGVRGRIPPAVIAHLEAGLRGEMPETVKEGDPLLARSRTRIVGNNQTAVEAARRMAERLGYRTVALPPLTGDAAIAGRHIAGLLRDMPAGPAAALVAGAEPTVQVVAGGRGGRAQHLALAASLALGDLPAVVLAAGTDGVDGPTDAAGALVDGTLPARARAAGVDLDAALARTDSHAALDALQALVRTGPTGTNVTDVVVALRAAC
jgi:hydroxypyruvate reductase